MLDWFSSLLGCIPYGEKLLERFRCPLHITVLEFESYEFVNRPSDALNHISEFPRKYWAKLRMSNRTEHEVVVQDMWVTINERLRIDAHWDQKLKISPRDFEDVNVIFPVQDHANRLSGGTYELHVRATRGREFVGRGTHSAPNS